MDPCLCSELHWCIPLHHLRDSYRLPALSLVEKLPALPQWKVPLALTCDRAAYAFQVEACCEKYVPRKFCTLPLLPAVALTGACSASLNVLARSSGFLVIRGVIRFRRLVRSVRRGAFLQVACAFPSGKGPCEMLCPSVNCRSWKVPCEKHVPRVIAISLALTCERAAYAFQVEACWEKYVPQKFCTLPLLPAVALTGACSASLNVLARSSGFLVLRGAIRFGRLRTPLVHSSSFVLGGKILHSASRGFLCCLPKEKEFGLYRVPIFASPPRGAGGTPKYLPCSVLSSQVAVSVAWPAGSYARALGFGALCWYTGSSTSIFPPSVRRSLRATAAPASDRAGSVGRAYAAPLKSRSWILGWVDRSASGVHRSSRPFCRRCALGLNWPGRASCAITLKKLECSKQAYALDTLAWDNIIGFRSYYVGLRDRNTVLVSTINDADQGSADVTFRTPLAPYEKSKFLGSGGSMVARLKLKGIDGRAPPGVEPAA
ncbi:hypothetical protein TEA_006787 [Camellia sinensis var. sinensis]|uniref:Uncharacterized protein n=1 Tax=Camellia sinensis var. sinensis TaxID=542762 RepID=A0A4S4D5N1_CAMSN|nr:hypothetical protein TEA_006787 [Camellia sinensis var. sinensis]